MTTENKRMSQLLGNYAELDLSQLLNGELALPTDHNPVFKDGAGNVRELLTAESAGYLEDLIAEMNAGLAEIEQIIIQRIGINDEEVSLLETFSSSKITDLLADKQDSLTAGDNVQISAGNVISATDTTYTAGANIQISASNEISATDTTYTAGTNITIDSNNQINCNVLNDTAASSTTTTYSSAKIRQIIAEVGGVAIDDTTPSTTTVYSSSKTENLINTSLSQLKDLLYPVGCIVHTTAYSTTAQMVNAYGGSDWDLIQEKVLIGANWVDASNPKYRVNATGGSETVTLAIANLPSHNHSYTYRSSSTGSTTLTINQMPEHNHYQNVSAAVGGSANRCDYNSDSAGSPFPQGITTDSTGGNGSHYHSVSGYSSTTGNAGSGSSFSILPPYKSVYIWTRTA